MSYKKNFQGRFLYYLPPFPIPTCNRMAPLAHLHDSIQDGSHLRLKKYVFYLTDNSSYNTLHNAPRNTKRQNHYLILGLGINYPTITEINLALTVNSSLHQE